ncbi:20265_t:CDS:1, partial [Gigaspora rosea]
DYTYKKSTSSGILLFGLQLKKVNCNQKRLKQTRALKPVETLLNSTLTKRAINFSKAMYTNFQTCTNQFYYLNNKPVLESIRYSVKRHAYEVSYGAKDPKKLKQKEESVCRIQDEGHISCDTYSNLAAIEPYLPRVWAISERRKQITQNIAELVPISIIDIQAQAQ